ncbi:hypothetical protein SAMN05421874_14432 [Nonomuraea maritima]|uniref:Uncharacterized protein n=1 Tax=Nonomuraea maritima TaxID=683260 RepID=A0A1G9RAF1_9ACTN|nr:hypothetical protein [Nonomuraea maritima]SDM20289.1 hypothetical protein SAMN05421874_14432 [Nonomuraea maritima]
MSATPPITELATRYLQPLAGLPHIRPHLRLHARVAAITRQDTDRLRTPNRDQATEAAPKAPDTRLTWAIRSDDHTRAFGGGDDDALPARGALGTGLQLLIDKGVVELAPGFKIRAVRTQPDGAGVELVALDKDGSERTIAADRVVAATGYRPDHTITGELRLDLDPILE